MNYCTSCGHELGVGRFCTNCGRPVAGRHPGTPTDAPVTQPAPPAAPTMPRPPTGTLPPPPRFPLYAEPAGQAAPAPLPPRRRSLLPWLVVLLALVVIGATVGAVLLFRSGDHSAVDASPTGAAPSTGTASTAPSTTSPASSQPATPGTDLTPDITRIVVPGTAPASTDLAGNPVTFGSGHLVDHDSETAWRVPGDAAGSALTITFDQPVTVTSVGLINGYAKSYQGYNGYQLNRRITAVRWSFEDGTSVVQRLAQQPSMQTTPVTAETTSSIRLEIVSTVASQKRNWRDFTAISELSLTGSAQ